MAITYFKNIFRFFHLSSLNVVLVSIICSIAFFKLPLGQYHFDIKTIAQLACACWAIYIYDRLTDNIDEENPETDRHSFHKKYQYNFQILLIALSIIGLLITFFQPIKITFFGLGIVLLMGLYYFLLKKTKNFKFYKELAMPFIYVLAIVGLPFYMSSSINLSSWFLAGMFLLVIFQNMFAFSYFEYVENQNVENICKKISVGSIRKIINYSGSINLFIVIFLFSNGASYSNQLAFVFLAISVFTSLIVALPDKFQKHYRWIIDGLLFFPLFIF